MTARFTALGAHCFMGGFTCGMAESLEVQAQLEVFTLGEKTVEHNLGIPFYRGDFEAWPSVASKFHGIDVLFGNPRCTGFSALGHGCSEDAHGAWARPTVDIRQFAELASWLKPSIWAFESVQQAGTTGRPLIEWLHHTHGAGYTLYELYHNANMFGNSQWRPRVIFMWVDQRLQPPLTTVTNELRHRGPHVLVHDVLYGQDNGALWNCPALPVFDLSTLNDLEGVVKNSPTNYINHHYWWKTTPASRAYFEAALKLAPGENVRDLPWADLPERLQAINLGWHVPHRLHPDRPCKVIYSGSWHYFHPDHQRPLSVREMARCMGLPDDWVVIGDDGAAQIGKGVCVEVGRWFGKLCNETLTTGVSYKGDQELVELVGPAHYVARLDRVPGWRPKKPRAEVYRG